eukprot:SAG31_NODE_4473_length_3203_cov_2.743557_2_plen_44_part_00
MRDPNLTDLSKTPTMVKLWVLSKTPTNGETLGRLVSLHVISNV